MVVMEIDPKFEKLRLSLSTEIHDSDSGESEFAPSMDVVGVKVNCPFRVKNELELSVN